MSHGWLADFIRHAATRKWCNRLWCTTCGALEFRGELARRVCKELGVTPPEPPESRHIPSRPALIYDLQGEWHDMAVESVARELASVRFSDFSSICTPEYAEDCIGMTLYEIGVRPDQPLIFQSDLAWQILRGSEVHDYACRWKACAGQKAERRRQRDEFESPEAAAQRRDERLRRSAEAASARLAEKQARDDLRKSYLESLAAMTAGERLLYIASSAEPWPLDAICQSLVAELVPEVRLLSPEQRIALIERIGHRKGVWRRLRKELETLRS